jgi:hypothetical protein
MQSALQNSHTRLQLRKFDGLALHFEDGSYCLSFFGCQHTIAHCFHNAAERADQISRCRE